MGLVWMCVLALTMGETTTTLPVENESVTDNNNNNNNDNNAGTNQETDEAMTTVSHDNSSDAAVHPKSGMAKPLASSSSSTTTTTTNNNNNNNELHKRIWGAPPLHDEAAATPDEHASHHHNHHIVVTEEKEIHITEDETGTSTPPSPFNHHNVHIPFKPKATHPPPAGFVITARVYIDPADKLAYIDDDPLTLPYWDCGAVGSTTSPLAVKEATFRHSLTTGQAWLGTDGKHPYLCVALTECLLEVSGGANKLIHPGQVVLLEDVLIPGHKFKPLQADVRVLLLTLPKTHYATGKEHLSLPPQVLMSNDDVGDPCPVVPTTHGPSRPTRSPGRAFVAHRVGFDGLVRVHLAGRLFGQDRAPVVGRGGGWIVLCRGGHGGHHCLGGNLGLSAASVVAATTTPESSSSSSTARPSQNGKSGDSLATGACSMPFSIRYRLYILPVPACYIEEFLPLYIVWLIADACRVWTPPRPEHSLHSDPHQRDSFS